MTLVLATRNAGKVRELRALLAAVPLRVVCLGDLAGVPPITEEALSLEENAAAKAWAVCRFTGSMALGEDTGLEVDALGGAPGPRAARYFGEGAGGAGRCPAGSASSPFPLRRGHRRSRRPPVDGLR